MRASRTGHAVSKRVLRRCRASGVSAPLKRGVNDTGDDESNVGCCCLLAAVFVDVDAVVVLATFRRFAGRDWALC